MRTLAALCLLALTTAGCGAASQDSSKDFQGDQRAVAATVEALETAARKNDPGRVCSKLLTSGLLAALRRQGTNCKTAVKESFKDADSLTVKVDDVRVSGDTATVKATSASSGDDKTYTLELARVGGAWKISLAQ